MSQRVVKISALIGLILGTSVFFACATTQDLKGQSSRVRMSDVNAPLGLIVQSAAFALPGGVRESSENRRIFQSKHIDLNGNRWDVLSSEKWRAYAEIAVLGDRRPYSVEVDVVVEERESTDPRDQEFQPVGQSRPLAEKIAQKMKGYLEDRRKKRDLIDEFRAF